MSSVSFRDLEFRMQILRQTSWNFILKCMCHVRRATSTSDLPSCAITDLTKCDVIVAVEMLYERRFSAEVRSSNASCADQLLLIAKGFEVHSISHSDLHSDYIACSALSALVCAHIWPPFPPGDRAQYKSSLPSLPELTRARE